MGLGLSFVQGEGPVFREARPGRSRGRAVGGPDPNVELKAVMDAVSSIRKALNNRVPLIGFSGSPFTLACYMVEGRGSRDFRTVKTMMYRRPDLFHRILEVNAEAVALYLNAQIKAGAQAVQIFDTWAACSPTATSRRSRSPTRRRSSKSSSAKTTAPRCPRDRLHEGRRRMDRRLSPDRLRTPWASTGR